MHTHIHAYILCGIFKLELPRWAARAAAPIVNTPHERIGQYSPPPPTYIHNMPTCIHTRTRAHTYKHTLIHTHMHAYIHTRINTNTHRCIHKYVQTYIRVN